MAICENCGRATTMRPYKVTKIQSGGNGKEFSYPSKTFSDEPAAVAYAAAFTLAQFGVGGTRIRLVGPGYARSWRCS